MRFIGLLFLLFSLLVVPARASLDFPLSEYRLDLWRDTQGTTIRRYLLTHPQAIFASTSAFSDRRGAPVGLLMVDGIVRQGITQRRCLFQISADGRRAEIGYDLRPWAYEAFQAGPCISAKTGEKGIYANAQAERFSRMFITEITARSVICLGKDSVTFLRFRGPLLIVPAKMKILALQQCINADGGQQLSPSAINPAILGILRPE